MGPNDPTMPGPGQMPPSPPPGGPVSAPGGQPPPPGASGPPTSPQGPEQGDSDGLPFEPANEQERIIATKAFENMLDNIYGEGWETLVQELKASPPEQLSRVVGQEVAMLYMAEEMFARQAGKELPQSIAISVGTQLVEEFMEILDSQQIYTPENEEEAQQFMGEALMIATDLYKQKLTQTGQYDEQAAQQLAQAIESGQYDQAAPGAPSPSGPGVGAPPAPAPSPGSEPGPMNVYEQAKRSAGGM